MNPLLFLNGLVFGILVSIPMGPIGVVCVQRTLQKGRLSGFISGLGAAIADTFFATIAGFGIGFFVSFFNKNHFILMIFGGVLLIVLGAKLFFSKTIKQLRAKKTSTTYLGDFVSVFLLTLTNPITIIFFGGVFASSGILEQGLYNISFVTLGIFAGALFWWFLLTTLVNFFRDRFRLRILFWINKGAGIMIMFFGILAIINAFYPQF